MSLEKLILTLPKESKLEMLKHFLANKDLDTFFAVEKILLNAGVNEGGLETDVLKDLFKKEMGQYKSDSLWT